MIDTKEIIIKSLEQNVTTLKGYNDWLTSFSEVHGGVGHLKKIDCALFKNSYSVELHDEELIPAVFILESIFYTRIKALIDILVDLNSSPKKQSTNLFKDEKITYYNWFSETFSELANDYKTKMKEKSSLWAHPENGDIVAQIYNELFDKKIRHAIGAFFTPEWLALHTIKEAFDGHDDILSKRVLEPTCGSGVFLLAIYQYLSTKVDNTSLINFIVNNIYLNEINPIAALGTKLNWLRVYIACGGTLEEPIKINISNENCLDYNNTIPQDSFDFVVGNPPWINWESLSEKTRRYYEKEWPRLGLVDEKSKSFSKEDISTLITYFCIDTYIRDTGKLCFLMPQTILQSAANSRGFRSFIIKNSDTKIKVSNVFDFTKVKVFKNVSARTCVITLLKNSTNTYPVPYIKAIKIEGSDLWSKKISFTSANASPSNETIDSSWSIHEAGDNNVINQLKGTSAYKARAGMFTGGANSVYYIDILSTDKNNFFVKNISERAKIKTPEQEFPIEADVVYPFIRGRDVSLWHCNYNPKSAVIFPHNIDTRMLPINERTFKIDYPLAYSYLKSQESLLINRGGLTKLDTKSVETGFYTLLRIGDYTFSKYKVAWKYIAKNFTPCVIVESTLLGGVLKPTIPQEKLMIIAVDNSTEAYFLCGYLSSEQVRLTIEAKMVSTQISAGIINGIHIPKFDHKNQLHIDIATICKEGHSLLEINQDADISLHLLKISTLVGKII